MGIEVTDNAKDIITKLLSKDPKTRLGTTGDIDEILQHPWFADVNLDDLMNKKIPSPYIPQVKTNAELVADSLQSTLE